MSAQTTKDPPALETMPPFDRRTFLRTVTVAAAGVVAFSRDSFARPGLASSPYFAVNPFIEQNPSAVFILRTSVDVKTNAAAICAAGRAFGHSVFLPSESPGFPVESLIAIKPNLTSRERNHPQYTIERSMGIVTDANFVEGIIESLKSLGAAGSQCYIREINSPEDFADGGYIDMAARTGAEIRSMRAPWVGSMPPEDLQWKEIPEGVWFRRIPYLWPINGAGTFLLNIAKFKAHTMGITGCAKNLQGSMASGYQTHCTLLGTSMNMRDEDICEGAESVVQANYDRHVADGIPRWDRPGLSGGIRQELWASRCLDNNSVTKPALHIMEGIYGRDGHFMDGPGPDGLATDYMTNVVLFGKNPFHVDIIAHWLAGHEPGNLGLFHLAVERGQSETINPSVIQLFEWNQDGSAIPRNLGDFTRTPLKTIYLRRDYGGQTEDVYHLVNEPYTYAPTSVASRPGPVPDAIELSQGYPNPFNARVSIRFTVPQRAEVLLGVYDINGQRVAVLANGVASRGAHLVTWDAGTMSSGVYFYRLISGGTSLVRSIVLLN